MNIQSLPRYGGLCDSPKGWGEPDGHGKRPSLRLRDYVVLALILIMGFPIFLRLGGRLSAGHRYAERLNSVREKEIERETRQMLFEAPG
jgi:hypothetical protein